MKIRGIEPATSWLVVRHADHFANEVVIYKVIKLWNSILPLKGKISEVFDTLLYDVEFNLTGL